MHKWSNSSGALFQSKTNSSNEYGSIKFFLPSTTLAIIYHTPSYILVHFSARQFWEKFIAGKGTI